MDWGSFLTQISQAAKPESLQNIVFSVGPQIFSHINREALYSAEEKLKTI